MSFYLRDGTIDKDSFKIVYIAPMKALVNEMVGNFKNRLECNIFFKNIIINNNSLVWTNNSRINRRHVTKQVINLRNLNNCSNT